MSRLGEWEALEDRARATFDESFGTGAPPVAQKIGKKLTPRLVFGWGALREKLVAREAEINDIDLELVKALVLRAPGDSPVMGDAELRLIELDADELVLAWLNWQSQALIEALRVPRALFEDVADPGFQELRDRLAGALYVDMQRLLLRQAA